MSETKDLAIKLKNLTADMTAGSLTANLTRWYDDGKEKSWADLAVKHEIERRLYALENVREYIKE